MTIKIIFIKYLLILFLSDIFQENSVISDTAVDHKNNKKDIDLTLPIDLVALERHFDKKCVMHNDDHKRRSEVKRMRRFLLGENITDAQVETHSQQGTERRPNHQKYQMREASSGMIIDCIMLNTEKLFIEYHIRLHHGIRKIQINKEFENSDAASDKARNLSNNHNCDLSSTDKYVNKHTERSSSELESKLSQLSLKSTCDAINMPEERNVNVAPGMNLSTVLDDVTYLNLRYVHVYSEGSEMTLADLILLCYIYYLSVRYFKTYWNNFLYETFHSSILFFLSSFK